MFWSFLTLAVLFSEIWKWFQLVRYRSLQLVTGGGKERMWGARFYNFLQFFTIFYNCKSRWIVQPLSTLDSFGVQSVQNVLSQCLSAPMPGNNLAGLNVLGLKCRCPGHAVCPIIAVSGSQLAPSGNQRSFCPKYLDPGSNATATAVSRGICAKVA